VDFKNSGKTQTPENRLKFREFFKCCVIIVDVNFCIQEKTRREGRKSKKLLVLAEQKTKIST
jgi:hypothetical protein